VTTTRPGTAVGSARSQTADRDEYPALGEAVTTPMRPGRTMGPTPQVHLGRVELRAASVRSLLGRPVASPVSPDVVAIPGRTSALPLDLGPAGIPTPVAVRAVAPLPEPMYAARSTPEPVRSDATEWMPVDPLVARAVLRVRHEVEIPQGGRSRRRPRPPHLSSGDATERLLRLTTLDRRRRVIMVAASVVVIVGMFAALWRFTNAGYAEERPATSWDQVALPDSTTSRPTSSAGASSEASATTGPTAQQTEAAASAPAREAVVKSQVNPILSANAIYGSPITGSCPEQAKPTTTDDARTVLSAYVDCMNAVWGPIIDAGKIRFRPASIYFYANTIVTACTTLHTSDPVTAMYCPMDATIYVSPTGLDSAVGSRFYASELVTHEYAHHVQSLTQILAVAQKQGWSDDEYSRRIQLQAHCLSFAVLTHVSGFAPDPAIFRVGWQVGPGSTTYGSVPSLQYWGEKGLSATKVGDCETFSVQSALVA